MRFAGGLSALALAALAACGQPADGPTQGDPNDVVAATPAAPKGRFEPRNECIEMPGAKAFFLALENAIRMRDADLLLSNTSADVQLDFGGGAGLTTLRERLSDKDGQLWTALDAATTMGCARTDEGEMVMPWYAAQPMNDIDPGRAMIVTGKDVPVRSTAAPDGPQVGSVSWDPVTLTDGLDPDSDVQKVTLADGTEGYIATAMLRSPLDYRLRVAPVGDGWQIVSFVNGD